MRTRFGVRYHPDHIGRRLRACGLRSQSHAAAESNGHPRTYAAEIRRALARHKASLMSAAHAGAKGGIVVVQEDVTLSDTKTGKSKTIHKIRRTAPNTAAALALARQIHHKDFPDRRTLALRLGATPEATSLVALIEKARLALASNNDPRLKIPPAENQDDDVIEQEP